MGAVLVLGGYEVAYGHSALRSHSGLRVGVGGCGEGVARVQRSVHQVGSEFKGEAVQSGQSLEVPVQGGSQSCKASPEAGGHCRSDLACGRLPHLTGPSLTMESPM